MARRITPVTCYEKEYESCKSLAADFGFNENQYWKLVRELRKGIAVETIVEGILENTDIKNAATKTEEVKKEVINTESVKEEPKQEVVEEIVKEESEMMEMEDIDDEDEPIFINRPKHYIIDSPLDIIQMVEKYDPSEINIIDFENVNSNLDTRILNGENNINIFIYNATHYSNCFYKAISRIPENINLLMLTFKPSDQLVDHLITYCLGMLQIKFPNKKYNIISKDNGFSGIIDMLRNVELKDGNKLSKDERFKFSLFKFILDIDILKHRDILSNKEFDNIFIDFVKQDEDPNVQIPRYIEKLEDYGVISKRFNGGFCYIKFDMKQISNFIAECHL